MENIYKTLIERQIIPRWLLIAARNFSTTMLSSTADSVLRFLAYGYLANRLGPEAFGVNAYMYATMLVFGSIADFGLRIFGAREIAANPGNFEEKVSTIISLKLALMVISYGLMQIFVLLTRGTVQAMWLSAIYGLSLFGLSTADWILMGLEQMHYISVARLVNGVGVFLLTLVFVDGPQDLLVVGGIESVTFLLAGGCLLFIASRKVRIRPSFQLTEWRAVLEQTAPLGVSLILVRFGASIPILALGYFSSDYEVGIYKAVSLIPSFFDRFNMILGDALLPTLSRIYAESERRFAAIMIGIQKYLSIMGVLLSALVGVLLGPSLLSSIFGQEFRAGVGVFQILMLASAVTFSNLTLRKLFSACKAQKRYAYTMILRTSILLVLSLVLARHGSRAESWAVLVAEFCALLLSVFFFQEQFSSDRLSRMFLKIAISGGVSVSMLWFLKSYNWFIAVSASLLAYGLGLFLLRVISLKDLEFVESPTTK